MTVKERYALNKVAGLSLCKWTARFREEEPRPLFRRLSEASSWMTVTRRGPGRRRCELVLRFQYGRTGDGGAFLSMLRFALASALAVTAALPAVAPPRVLDGFAGNGRRFRHGPGLLCGFRRGLFAVGLADLGKRRRVAVFRAGSACETAQKLQAGFARAEGSASKHVFQSRRRWSQVLRLLSCVR